MTPHWSSDHASPVLDDVQRLPRQVDNVLDSEDAFIILVDGTRAISQLQHRIGLSACQLELLAADIERVIRTAGGRNGGHRKRGPPRDANGESDDGARGGHDRGDSTGHLLQLARKISSRGSQ